MTNVDMVAFKASSTGTPSVEDMWSTGYSRPSTDTQNDYVTTYTTNSSHVLFTSTRALSTGDPNDYQISLVSI
jgi:hypothetical protein